MQLSINSFAKGVINANGYASGEPLNYTDSGDYMGKAKPNIPKLEITPIQSMPQFFNMISFGVKYVHGSNSNSFEGLTKFRALLSMEEIDCTPWFHRNGIQSGELGYTVGNLYKGQPISQGVSLNYIGSYLSSIYYSSLRPTINSYPVLYGIGSDIEISNKLTEHPVSVGGIGIDNIKAIYVPKENLNEAKISLSSITRLLNLIRPLL